ncbi:MAG: transporter substrate-binding domain-containing protein [Paludibacter sp.]|nr:transporter substrate-binding domain-containing protein [Paludibacter sp.]
MIKKIQIGIGLAILVFLVGLFVVLHFKRNKIHDLPSIMKSGRLSVLTDSSSLGFSVKDDSISGFQYEIVKAFADSLGLELVISKQNNIATCMDNLKSGDYDIVANFIPITTEWKNDVLFSEPIFSSRQILVQQIQPDSVKSELIIKHYDLAHKTICIPEGSPFKMLLTHLSNEIASSINIVEVQDKSPEQLVQMVASGKIKYTICDEQFAEKLKLKYPNIDISLPIGFEQDQAWAVRSNSTQLLNKLNDFLDDFIGSTAYWEIYKKYY